VKYFPSSRLIAWIHFRFMIVELFIIRYFWHVLISGTFLVHLRTQQFVDISDGLNTQFTIWPFKGFYRQIVERLLLTTYNLEETASREAQLASFSCTLLICLHNFRLFDKGVFFTKNQN
jgi:predicted subunit of tRNA(5-methylaminomethyl-2-thiouridylate) methyltransferase